MVKYLILLAVLLLALAGCGDEQPPTQIYIVLSPTAPANATEGATEDAATPPGSATSPATQTAAASPAATTPAATAPATTAAPASTAQPTTRPASATPAPEIFPTNTVADVAIAEQVFEHGRMFWLRHNRQIWVMVASADDPKSGDWYCYNDTFEEGEQEIDPSLTPPEGLYQPRRGFGKLWRNNPELKEGLGWAATPEFELTSHYTYIPGGSVQNNQYNPGPGEHRLTTLYNETISFFEGDIRGDCQGGTWRMAPSQ